MFVSPPSGRAPSRAASALARIHGPGALGLLLSALLVVLLALALVLSLGAGAADAKKKKKKDKRAPFVTKSVTVDSDGNGRVDGVILTYSEKVKIAKIKTGKGKAKKKNKKKNPWKASRAIGTVKVLSGGKTVSVKLAEGDAADSAERPSLAYIRVPKGAKGVVDRAGNQALTASLKPADGLPPAPVSGEAHDTDSDGQLDTVRLTYGEAVRDPVASQFIVAGYVVTGAAAAGATVDLTVGEQGVDTNATPTVAAISGAVKDAAGNDQAVDFSVAAADRAAPAIIDAVTADTNANGRIDRVTVRFSELISHVAESGIGAVTAVGMTTTSVSSAAVDSVVVELNDAGGGYTTNLKPDLATAASAQPVRDAAGNATGAGTYKSTRDGAPPLLMGARTRDGDGDGEIDAIVSTFSEPVIYAPDGVLSHFTSTAAELGTFGPGATSAGGVVTAAVNEDSLMPFNGCLPGCTPAIPVPVSYTPPVSGGAEDGAGNAASARTVQATDGAGPAIVHAETVDDAPADGRIDGVKVGFSEPVASLAGNPFTVASGVRFIVDDSEVTTDGTQQIPGGTPGQLLYGGVTIPLHPLTTDGTIGGPLADPDGADTPTVDYATITSGSTKSDFAADAAGNDVVATGATAFTGTLDRVSPLLRTMQTLDVNADGYIDRLNSTWTEPIATDGTPAFAALNPQNAPLSGYTPPTVAAGATAAGYSLSVNLNAASLPDRDITFESQYVSSGPTDAGVADAAGNNAPTTPMLPTTTAALCADPDEASSTGQDDLPLQADATPLAVAGDDALGTLCGADADYYSFTAGAGEVVTVLLSIAPQALVQRVGNSYNPFVASGPGGSQSVSATFDDATGWTGTFTAPSAGTYTLGVYDNGSPLLDYGYCVSRTDDGSPPSCSLSQGDFVVTEMLNEVGQFGPNVGPYVEFKNVTGLTRSIDAGHKLSVAGQQCTLDPYPGTDLDIDPGEIFYVTNVDDASTTNDFDCATIVNGFDLGQPVTLSTGAGVVDSVNFAGLNIPSTYTIQLRRQTAWETSAGNDDLANGWCLSQDAYGTWGTDNGSCDDFRINEVGFLPASAASRDGQVYVELKGSGAVTPVSSMLAGWRIRVKPQGQPGAFFVLPANATPNSSGHFVLADSPPAGETQVPLFSIQSKNVAAGDDETGGGILDGRDLDDYLRADRPVTVKLFPPATSGPNTYKCDLTAIDTLGFVPNTVGSQAMTDDDGVCGSAYTGARLMPPLAGYQPSDAIQRANIYQFDDNNATDFCALDATVMQTNYICIGDT